MNPTWIYFAICFLASSTLLSAGEPCLNCQNDNSSCDCLQPASHAACCQSMDCCTQPECLGSWRENTVLWLGGDAYKSIGDAGLAAFNPLPFANANSFGIVAGFNTGLPLGDSEIRAQLGASYGAYDLKGRTIPPKQDSLEQQTYLTFGLYRRGIVEFDDRISWGVVFDQFFARQWGWAGNEVYLSQIRGLAGYALNETNEVGIWGAVQTQNDFVNLNNVPVPSVRIHTVNQLNNYWLHNWVFGGSTMAYVGIADAADVASWQLGTLSQAPLSHCASVYANYTYVAPGARSGPAGGAEEQWNVSAGLVFHLGGKSASSTVTGHRGLPLLPVANNGSFLISN